MTERWCILILRMPGRSTTPRMRVWRALKARGAGILRDGVYVLPDLDDTRRALHEQADAVREAGGAAYLLHDVADRGKHTALDFRELFDRGAEFEDWLARTADLVSGLAALDEAEGRRREAQLRRDYEAIASVDYFPGESGARATRALEDMRAAVNARFSPDEPAAGSGDIEVRDAARFQGRLWATRRNLWVDRVASAWLIRRFIDARASFRWLAGPADCPPDAVGFDFDGAPFSHVGARVTFEVLLRAFALDQDAALVRMGALVHYLDVGGVPVAEAAGFLALLGGIRRGAGDDDALLAQASVLLDHLYAAYTGTPQ